MIRKFYVNMYQKGQFNKIRNTEIKKCISFEKTENKAVQIVSINEDIITDVSALSYIYSILGINDSNVYKVENGMREITDKDIERYKALDKKYITKETSKAFFIDCLDLWIPKSQSMLKGNVLYIKNWILFKNLVM